MKISEYHGPIVVDGKEEPRWEYWSLLPSIAKIIQIVLPDGTRINWRTTLKRGPCWQRVSPRKIVTITTPKGERLEP